MELLAVMSWWGGRGQGAVSMPAAPANLPKQDKLR